jgi:hypothetical protein
LLHCISKWNSVIREFEAFDDFDGLSFMDIVGEEESDFFEGVVKVELCELFQFLIFPLERIDLTFSPLSTILYDILDHDIDRDNFDGVLLAIELDIRHSEPVMQ